MIGLVSAMTNCIVKLFRTQGFQRCPFLLEIFHGVVFINFVDFKKSIEFISGSKTQQTPQFGLGDMAALEFFESEALERPARKIAARPGHATGDIVGDVDGEFHKTTLLRRGQGVKLLFDVMPVELMSWRMAMPSASRMALAMS